MASNMMTINSPVFFRCEREETLGWDNDYYAKELLKRAADQVRPLMARRKWKVGILEEFYPPHPNLHGLNVNHGERIKIRLRQHFDRTVFLSYQSILGTLLHELVHIEIGPHNETFYRMLNELKSECDELIRDGVTGLEPVGFQGRGRRLGDGLSRGVSRSRLREVAAAAAMKRFQRQSIMGSGRLGGDREIFVLCDPREMALAAAERRQLDDVWCGGQVGTDSSKESQSSGLRRDQASSREAGKEIDVIDLRADDKANETLKKREHQPVNKNQNLRTRGAQNQMQSGNGVRNSIKPRAREKHHPNIRTRQTPAARAALRRLRIGTVNQR